MVVSLAIVRSVANYKGNNSYRTVVLEQTSENCVTGHFSVAVSTKNGDNGRGAKCDCADAPARHDRPEHCRNLLEKPLWHIYIGSVLKRFRRKGTE